MKKIVFQAILSFLIFTPLAIFILLVIKGLPSFAVGHEMDVFVWAYQVTWMPAAVSGLLFSIVLSGVRPWVGFFVRPFDFGRCFSLGAIAGALAEAFSTWAYRALTQHPFSSFWIAGSMMAGALTGSVIAPVLFRRMPSAS